MDLNEVPPEYDYDFINGSSEEIIADPPFGTQAAPAWQNSDLISEIRLSLEDTTLEDEQVSRYEAQLDNACLTQDALNKDALNQDGGINQNSNEQQTNALEAAPDQLIDGDQEQQTDAHDVVEEIWCTPPVPYTGQTFSTKKEAKEFYNAYAKRIGFSIRIGTTRLSATRELKKVEFLCNKEGRGRKGKEKAIAESEEDSPPEEESEPESNNKEGTVKKKRLDGGKKRKREKMQHTNCKAKMVVKLICERWQVIYFVAEHNHDLVVKTSLKKFLRSHRGIPKQEKDFIVLLHECNIRTGRIMQLMSEFYGSAQLLPYDGRDIGNFRSTLRREEKYRDMQETLDRFKELAEHDPEFFCKIKLDFSYRVESIF